jgi:hypothetical protein
MSEKMSERMNEKVNEKTRRIVDANAGTGQPVDQLVLPLVNAINSLTGLKTVSSCEGHGKNYPHVLFTTDGSHDALASMCIVAHALKGYGWRMVASPVGSVGDLYLRFVITPGTSLVEDSKNEPVLAQRAAEPEKALEAREQIKDIAGRIVWIANSSKFVPDVVD